MYRIIKDGADIGLTENLNYIKQADNGCFVLCSEPEAAGFCYEGVVYHILGREAIEGKESVTIIEADAGAEITETKEAVTASAKLTGQMSVATRLYVQASTDIPDGAALAMPDLFRTWEEALAAGVALSQNTILNDGGTLYRVVQAGGVIPQQHQPPHGEGMLAVYRPIDTIHAGTQEHPIPWVYGMDCTQGKYYNYNGALYLCNADMPACIWAPGTTGLWQWEAV